MELTTDRKTNEEDEVFPLKESKENSSKTQKKDWALRFVACVTYWQLQTTSVWRGNTNQTSFLEDLWLTFRWLAAISFIL